MSEQLNKKSPKRAGSFATVTVTAETTLQKQQAKAKEEQPKTHTQIKAQIKRYVEKLPGAVWLGMPGGGGRAGSLKPGTPDVYITGLPLDLFRTSRVWLEVKAGKDILRENQKNMIAKLEAAGDEVIVVRSLEEFIYVLERS